MPASPSPAAIRRLALAVLALGGAGVIVVASLLAQRADFDTEGRIAHRLLSQRVAQLDATLATLTLLQPAAADAAEQRLPAVVAPVLQVLRRDADGDWPGAQAQRQALAEAESLSRRQRRAVVALADAARGRYLLVQAGTPTSFALWVDVPGLVPRGDWPYAAEGRTQVTLQVQGQPQRLTAAGTTATATTTTTTASTVDPAAAAPADTAAGPALRFAKPLASDSQPFDLQVRRVLRLADLPWLGLLAWAMAMAAAARAWQVWLQQRSERRRAQELLRLGQVGRLNALGELAAGMAHELNQPLAAVSANVQAAQRLLADDDVDLPQARHAMAQAVQQSRRAAEVVARLRRLVERPDVASRLQPVDLAATVQGALDLLQPECQRLGVQAELQLAAAPAVQADPVALEQIVHNLLSNALQALAAAPEGRRRLTLHARRGASQVQLDVADSGPGLPPEVLPHVFEPFFSTREGGLGLGLSLCESLATGMGGSLLAANTEHGPGAVFSLRLPLAGEGPAVPPGDRPPYPAGEGPA